MHARFVYRRAPRPDIPILVISGSGVNENGLVVIALREVRVARSSAPVITIVAIAVATLVMPPVMMIPLRISVGTGIPSATVIALCATRESHSSAEKNQQTDVCSHLCSEPNLCKLKTESLMPSASTTWIRSRSAPDMPRGFFRPAKVVVFGHYLAF